MEAIYLERRENDLGFIKVILAMALLGTIWYYNKFSFGILQVMAWLSFTALIGTFTLLIARRGIQSISAQYHLVSNVWRHAGIKSMLLPMLRIFMIVMLFQGVVMCAFLVPWKNWNPEVAYLVATAGGFGGAILLLAFALLYRPPSPADREKLDAEANEAFEVLIREKFAEPSLERSPKVLSRLK